MQPPAEERLLPEEGCVGSATAFSVILHVPLIVLLMHGTGRREGTQDVTPVLEAAYSGRPVSVGEYGPAVCVSPSGRERAVEGAKERLSSAGSLEMPRLLKAPGLCGIADRGGLLPKRSLPTGVRTEADRREPGRRWFNWYSSEIRQRISSKFPAGQLLSRGIRGEVYFQLRLSPDGSVRRVDVLRADHPALEKAAVLAVRSAEPFPGYRALGLERFPPLNITCSVRPQ